MDKHDAPAQDRTRTIVINGRPVQFDGKEITFEQVTKLAFPTAPYGENTAYTVTYKRGQSDNQEGSMVAGDSVKVKEGMVFNVTATDKS